MLFALICFDNNNSTALRAEVRPKHLAYIEAHKPRVKLAGPFLSDDGAAMIGSLLIVEADDLEAAWDFANEDPYAKAGLFAEIDVKPWRWVVGAPKE
jgi:hypothetical protein